MTGYQRHRGWLLSQASTTPGIYKLLITSVNHDINFNITLQSQQYGFHRVQLYQLCQSWLYPPQSGTKNMATELQTATSRCFNPFITLWKQDSKWTRYLAKKGSCFLPFEVTQSFSLISCLWTPTPFLSVFLRLELLVWEYVCWISSQIALHSPPPPPTHPRGQRMASLV